MDSAALLIAVRFALYVVLMLVFGLPLFSLYAWRGARPSQGPVALPRAALATLAVVGAGLSAYGFLLIVAQMSDVAVTALDRELVRALLDSSPMGSAAKVRVASLLVALPAISLLRRRPRLGAAAVSLAGGVSLASLAWTGHGAADEGTVGWIHLVADIGHLLAAGLWLGALAGLLLLLIRARTATSDAQPPADQAHHALASFATVGTIAVALIIVSGAVNSWILVGLDHVAGLAGSPYGRLLLIKLLLFGGMLGLAALNRFRLTPALNEAIAAGSHGSATRMVGRSVALETSLALVILGLVAWLGTLAPPASAG